GHLICAGTSATLGDTADTAPLREYARQVFGVPFDEHAVITENRLSAAEFLGDAPIEHVLQPCADLDMVLNPAQYTSPEAALVAWALAPDGQGPLVTLRLQVWMRELRRMVGKVTSDPARVELRADKDLKARPDGFYLPLMQCSECHTTGWLSRLAPASRKLS